MNGDPADYGMKLPLLRVKFGKRPRENFVEWVFLAGIRQDRSAALLNAFEQSFSVFYLNEITRARGIQQRLQLNQSSPALSALFNGELCESPDFLGCISQRSE